MKVMKYHQQRIPLQKAVSSSHFPCSQHDAAVREEFSAHAKSISVQVWKARHTGLLQVVKDATRS